MMVDTSWELQDNEQTFTFDGLIAENLPDIIVGDEVTLTLYTDSRSPNVADFNEIQEYAEFINENSTDYGTTFDGIPWYRFSTYPTTTISTYLFEVRPSNRIPEVYDFWGLLTNVEEVSRNKSDGGRLEMSFFVIAESENYTRTEIQNNFKSDL